MIRRAFVILGELLVVVMVLAAGLLFWASYYIDTEEFIDRFVLSVESVSGLPVTLHGGLDIAFYPSISLRANGLAFGGPSEFGKHTLIEFDKLWIQARILPLFDGELVLRSVLAEGTTINLIESKDDILNLYVVVREQAAAMDTGVDTNVGFIESVAVESLKVTDAKVSFLNLENGEHLELSGLNIETGPFVPGGDLTFTATSRFTWDSMDLDAEFGLKGSLETDGGKTLRLTDTSFRASVSGGFLPNGAEPGELTTNVALDWESNTVELNDIQVRFLGVRAEAYVKSGNMDEAYTATGRLVVHPFSPADIVMQYAPDNPVKNMTGLRDASLACDFSIDESGVALKDLLCTLDQLTVEGVAAMKGFQKPFLNFDLRGDNLDIDKFIPSSTSGEPFVWDDYPLVVPQYIRGRGKASLKELKVVGITLKDIHAVAERETNTYVFDATAKIHDDEPLTGKAEIVMDTVEESGNPLFGSKITISGKSAGAGFDYLDNPVFTALGDGRFLFNLNVPPMECPPDARAMELMRNLSADAVVVLGEGEVSYKGEESSPTVGYAKAECAVKISPSPYAEGEYGYNVDASLRGNGGKNVRTFSLSTKGVITSFFDKFHAVSKNLAVRGSTAGKLYSGISSRVALNGEMGFDTEAHTIDVKKAQLRTLETTVRGAARLTDVNTAPKVAGNLEIPGANAKRIVYLLTKYGIRTQDSQALRNISLSSDFSLDKSGFKLNNVKGKLDGMPYAGWVHGDGYDDPKLTFSLNGGKLNLDKYFPPSNKPTLKEIRSGKKKKYVPTELPLPFFRMLHLSGNAKFDEFQLLKMRSTDFSGHIEAKGGKIHLSKVTGAMYQGRLSGDWTGLIREKDLVTHLKLRVKDMNGGLFMKDIAGREYVRGKTQMIFDLTSMGLTDLSIVENLNGLITCHLDKGSYRFTHYTTPDVPVDVDSDKIGGNRPRNRTSFRKADASFAVRNGVLNVKVFRVEAPPVMQSFGSGWINLPKFTLDLFIRNDFVGIPSVTVRLDGPLNDPGIHVPTGRIVNDTVFNILSIPKKSFNFVRDLFK